MAKVFIEESTLTNIGNAIRNKTGKSELLSPASMATEIEAIQTGGGEIGEIVLSENCRYACSNPAWNRFLPYVRTENISTAYHMFSNNTTMESIPFELNFSGTNNNTEYLLENCLITTMPKINNIYLGRCNNMFAGATYIREITEDRLDIVGVSSGQYDSKNAVCWGCYSLRKAPMFLLNALAKAEVNTNNYNSTPYSMVVNCATLDELVGFYPPASPYTGNAFGSTVQSCKRLKDFTFALDENGQPYTRNWKNQTIDLSYYLGWTTTDTEITTYNSGITSADSVNSDASYQKKKDNPNWFAFNVKYSRYNHDSAVNTINSLPDVTSGSSNTIKFKGEAGSNTDGGAINTLTEEEIAVATAKGWTVSFV